MYVMYAHVTPMGIEWDIYTYIHTHKEIHAGCTSNNTISRVNNGQPSVYMYICICISHEFHSQCLTMEVSTCGDVIGKDYAG